MTNAPAPRQQLPLPHWAGREVRGRFVMPPLAAAPTRHIIERVSESGSNVPRSQRDLERGMYGREVPVRPAPGGGVPPRCLRGHDLTIARLTNSYHQRYQLDEITCDVCSALHDERRSWCLVDPARQHPAEDAPRRGLVLVRIPPTVRGGVGQMQLRIDGQAHADLDLAVCRPCRRAVLEQVRVDEGRRRRGYGWVLVAAALTLAPPSDYEWSTTRVTGTIARAFWARVPFPGTLGTPSYCTDMERAAGRLPDW